MVTHEFSESKFEHSTGKSLGSGLGCLKREIVLGSVIALDVGGSGVRACLVESGVPGKTEKRLLAERSVEGVLSVCEALVKSFPDVAAVGVALPGFASHGRIHSSPNFPGWSDVPFADLLAARIGREVLVENDASSAAWGAFVLRGSSEDLVLLTLGTGVGGGIVSDRKLLTGKVGCGAELGHLYVGGDALCGCGAIGCLEAWASTSGLIRISKSRGKSLKDGAELWAPVRLVKTGPLSLRMRQVVPLEGELGVFPMQSTPRWWSSVAVCARAGLF